MKKPILLILSLLVGLSAFAQMEFMKIDDMTYKFKTATFVKIPDDKTGNMLNSFYTDRDLSSKKTKIAYPVSKKESDRTSFEPLKGRVFEIMEILPPGEQGRRYEMLVLRDIDNGEMLYYYCSVSSMITLPFLVCDPELKRQEEERIRKEEERIRKKEEEKREAEQFKRDDYDQYRDLKLDKKMPFFYKNSTVIVKPSVYKSITERFYFDLDDTSEERKIPTLNHITKGTYKVTDVMKIEETGTFFVLQDIETGEVLYYKYSTFDSFPFLARDMEFTPEAAAPLLTSKTDSFTKVKTISSPYSNISIKKEIRGGTTKYILVLRTEASTLNVQIRGVKVLFDDDTIWSRNAEVDCSISSSGAKWIYYSYIPLTNADLQTFQNKKIKQFRLYIYDQMVTDVEAEIFPMFVKAIMEAK